MDRIRIRIRSAPLERCRSLSLIHIFDYIPDSNGERQRLEGLMRKSRLSLDEAKEKDPDW